ncbi:hypothetical protein F5884DRAFT_817266 [Xylogone sp. PMI_703]|nr:hypothetical protein F5884DRAFT_817266 [Xylogone sp. PMI_703]
MKMKSKSSSSQHKPLERPGLDRVDRSSFSSIKENAGVVQSFTDSKTSSYLRSNKFLVSPSEEAIEDSPTTTPPPEEMPFALTNPHSMLHGFVCPCENFKGWKGISVKGKVASRSYSDLNALRSWDWETKPLQKSAAADKNVTKLKPGQNLPGLSPLEGLPMEILGTIIDHLALDIPPNGFTARNIDLMSLLLTSRTIHVATLNTLYSHITIPHSRIFAKFLAQIQARPSLGTIVRRIDFSHFNPTLAGQTLRERAATLNVIPETILKCLSLTPNLREFLAQEHIDDDIDAKVIKTLLCDLPKLKAIDFCACSSTSFRDSFNAVIDASPSPLPEILPLTRLNLHECTILPSKVFATLLPRMPRLTHLDAAHTRITDEALFSIPQTARLTHLNLSRCSHLTGPRVVQFLTTHPAASTLVYLNLGMDAKSHELFSSEDLKTLIPVLPTTLRSLSLKGSKMESSHIPALLPLTKHLEELGLGRNINASDVRSLLFPSDDLPLEEQLSWTPHSLRYMDISDLSLQQLDLSSMFSSSSPLLTNVSRPLEVVELSQVAYTKLENGQAVKRAKWRFQEAGRRWWIVRDQKDEPIKDNGSRDWKWGANSWGMRKIPVARADVGGMYGLYMFKR